MYQSYKLTEMSRNLLLAKFSPKFENVSVHHITYRWGVKKDAGLPPEISSVKVIGYASNEHIECLVCLVDGTTDRIDGSTYHITISYDSHSAAKDSNDLLQNTSYERIDPIEIEVISSLDRA
jgi:hypothetical protein